MVGPTMNLISGTHHLCEKREYVFMLLREYTIIFLCSNIMLNYQLFKKLIVGSQIIAHTQMETGDGPNKPNTINL